MRLAAGCVLLSLLALVALVGSVRTAHADELMIKRPGQHPDYIFEAEPHLVLGIIDPPGKAKGLGWGLGFRGTVEFLDGPISSINNSMGIGFGADWVNYPKGGKCDRNDPFCDDKGMANLWLPVVLQWNFWLSRNWSVFGEPGLALRIPDDGDPKLDTFLIYGGGRFHFSDTVTLTLRGGHPTVSLGVSFLL